MLPVSNVGHQHTQCGAQQLPAVLQSTEVVGGVLSGSTRIAPQVQIPHEGPAAHHHSQYGVRQHHRPPVGLLHQRIDHQHQHRRDQERHAHIQRRVDTQIHPAERDEHRQHDQHHPQPAAASIPGDAAIGGHGVLCVTAGEGIPRGLRPGRLHNGEIRVLYPRPGHAAEYFQELIDDRAKEAHDHQVIALALADAPERRHGDDHEEQLAAQQRDDRHDLIQRRRADALQRVQNSHKVSLLYVLPLFYYTFLRRASASVDGTAAPCYTVKKRKEAPP